MSHDKYHLFESVIHITEERDKRSLEKTLIETLSNFIEFDTLILLRVPHSSDNKYLEVAASIPKTAIQEKLKQIPHDYGDQRVQIDDSMALCIKKGDIISDNQRAMGERTLFPIIVNNIVSGILDIYGHNSTTNTEKLISGFIRIYSNFQAIINDNEHDTLTGLLNRKTFDIQLSELLSSSAPEKNNVLCTGEERRRLKTDTHHWVGILDIDHFKAINDNFGHIYGDEVLLLFADLMKKTFRSYDLLFRYGGEEFVVVLASAHDSDAFMVLDRFRQRLELYDFPQVGRVTVSTGMVKINSQEHPTTVLEHADKALYYAKNHGRNQVRDYHELIKEGRLKEQHIKSNIEIF